MAQPTAQVGAALRGGLLVALLLVCTAVPSLAQATCPKGLKQQAVAELVFGRNIGDIIGAVDNAEWARFLDEVVTPRFRDGLTVLDAYGQWWNPPEVRIEREPAKLLLIVLTDEVRQQALIGEVAREYKRRFSQRSVMVMLRRACVTF